MAGNNIMNQPNYSSQGGPPKRSNNNSYPAQSMDGGQANALLDIDTNEYMVDMGKGNSNILVCVRTRPLSVNELKKQSVKNVRIMDEKIIILKDESGAVPEDGFRKEGRSKE